MTVYTCIGKGGRYRLLGEATGAGLCRTFTDLLVYQDVETGKLYFREPDDFADRMEAVEDDPGRTGTGV